MTESIAPKAESVSRVFFLSKRPAIACTTKNTPKFAIMPTIAKYLICVGSSPQK